MKSKQNKIVPIEGLQVPWDKIIQDQGRTSPYDAILRFAFSLVPTNTTSNPEFSIVGIPFPFKQCIAKGFKSTLMVQTVAPVYQYVDHSLIIPGAQAQDGSIFCEATTVTPVIITGVVTKNSTPLNNIIYLTQNGGNGTPGIANPSIYITLPPYRFTEKGIQSALLHTSNNNSVDPTAVLYYSLDLHVTVLP